MKKKLTLVIDDEIIERGKRHARSQGVSLSELVELYLADQTVDSGWSPPAGSALSRITGSVMADTAETDDDRRDDALQGKYA